MDVPAALAYRLGVGRECRLRERGVLRVQRSTKGNRLIRVLLELVTGRLSRRRREKL